MLLKDVLSLLKEYNSSQTNTTLAAKGGEKASGKNYDNIIAGKANPYKANEYETKYAKVFPALAEIVKKLKSNALKGDILINGRAAQEFQELLKSYTPRETAEGDYSLPFGDNVRVKQRSGALYIGYNDPNALHSTNTTDITKLPK